MAGAACKKENEITALHWQVDWLTRQLRLLRGQRFGTSSERTQAILAPVEQISLFNETESLESKRVSDPELEQVTYKRRKQKGEREMDFSGLPVGQIVHELPEDEQTWPECGNSLHICGHQVLRRELPMCRHSTRLWSMCRPYTAAATVSRRTIMFRCGKARSPRR